MKAKYKFALVSIAISSALLSGCKTGDIATKTAQAPSVETVTLTETKITPYHT
ncbi:TPA: efflux transporter periplasmic adaptor subunit, partial [Vibrio parahaemolyticus]|nr:efflux transporter periplasmic adaptor subunit [Vibrio parahaemolyticus]